MDNNKKPTPKQSAFLVKFATNDIVRDTGWENDGTTWIECLCDNKGDNAVFGSLLKAELMWSNGESCGLTDTGKAALRAIYTKELGL